MAEQSFHDLVALFSAGLALILLAGVCLTALRLPALVAAGGTMAIGAALAPWSLGGLSTAILPVAVVAGVTTATVFLGNQRLANWVDGTLARLRRPGVQAVVLAGAGTILAAGALVKFDWEDKAAIDHDMDFMLSATYRPPTHELAEVAVTDSGHQVRLSQVQDERSLQDVTVAEHQALTNSGMSERMIRVAPASDACNCHGWVFTGGRYWLTPGDVEQILADNGYHQVSDPQPGDLAIYREGEVISHTAVVRTAGNGSPVLVEGKWGWMGVFLHPVGDSCYGKNYTFYRSHRDGHLLTTFTARAQPAASVGQ